MKGFFIKRINLLLFVILLFFIKERTVAQIPDSIVIVKNTYVLNWNSGDMDSLSGKQSVVITEKKQVKKLMEELGKVDDENDLLSKFGIDTTYVKNNVDKMLGLYSGEYKFKWNEQQKDFIFKELSNIQNYKNKLSDYLSNGCCYGMHTFRRYEFVISPYQDGKEINTYVSRKYSYGFKMPYTDKNENIIYNYQIDKIIKKTFNEKYLKPLLIGEKLLKKFVNEIIADKSFTLHDLEAYAYLNEINALKSDFQIVRFGVISTSGRYGWEDRHPVKITLRNDLMLPNIYIQFVASKVGKTIYTCDSLKKDYKTIINRMQSISFIVDYIKKDTTTKLNIYYFNNKGINEYNIKGVNGIPNEWKRHEDYIESLKWYEKNNIEPNFDINKAIKTSEYLYCGCNYRFSRDFLEKAIFFELKNKETRANSVWFLLPDNNVLLYLMQGKKVLDYDYSDFGESYGIQRPCVIFDRNGQIIHKK